MIKKNLTFRILFLIWKIKTTSLCFIMLSLLYPKHMLNIPLLYWTSHKTGEHWYADIADRHAGNPAFLDAAKRSAHYCISAMADSGWLPPMDFRAPAEPVRYDSGAGVIIACGILTTMASSPGAASCTTTTVWQGGLSFIMIISCWKPSWDSWGSISWFGGMVNDKLWSASLSEGSLILRLTKRAGTSHTQNQELEKLAAAHPTVKWLPDGHPQSIYLNLRIGDFMVHLLQKR